MLSAHDHDTAFPAGGPARSCWMLASTAVWSLLLGCLACTGAPSAPLPSALPGTPSSGLPCVGVDAGCSPDGVCHGAVNQTGWWPDPGCPAGMFCSSRVPDGDSYAVPANVCLIACAPPTRVPPCQSPAGIPSTCPPGLTCVNLETLLESGIIYDAQHGWHDCTYEFWESCFGGVGFCADAQLWPIGALPGGPLSETDGCTCSNTCDGGF